MVGGQFWSDPRQLEARRTLDRAIEKVKTALDEAGVEMPVEIVALQATPSLQAALAGGSDRRRRAPAAWWPGRCRAKVAHAHALSRT